MRGEREKEGVREGYYDREREREIDLRCACVAE